MRPDHFPKINVYHTAKPLQVKRLETLFEVVPDQIGICINKLELAFRLLEGVKLYVCTASTPVTCVELATEQSVISEAS